MQRADFVNEMRRLTTGFRRDEAELTQERVAALYEHFAHVDAEVFRQAVSRLLMDTRYPSIGMMEKAVEYYADQKRRRGLKRDDDAARGVVVDGRLWPTSAVDQPLRRFIAELAYTAHVNGLTPEGVIPIMERARGSFTDQRLVDGWLADLRLYGSAWPSRTRGVYKRHAGRIVADRWHDTMPDGRTVVRWNPEVHDGKPPDVYEADAPPMGLDDDPWADVPDEAVQSHLAEGG